MKGKIIALFIVILIIAIIGFWLMTIPVSIEYKQKVQSHIVMARDQATFTGVKEQVLIIWNFMNETFPHDRYDYMTTYNTPWFWDYTYDNSLMAQESYFKQLVIRLDMYQKQMESNTTLLMTDWYDKSMQNVRIEMDREGGLDWALQDVWYLNKHPFVYWSSWIMGGLFILIIGLFILSWVVVAR